MTTAATYQSLGLNQLRDFPLNPREHWGDMTALEASIRAQGVLEPILVRPAGDHFQVIAGARRVKAARAAKLEAVPAIVREATDAQALEIALVENGNRHDVHRLNEAIALDGLMKLDKTYTPAVLATHLGRPEKYIRETLKLLSLEPAARKAYAADEITAGHAVILSRLPKDQQADGLAACFGRLWGGDGEDKVLKSVKSLEAWVRDHAPLELASPSQETRELFPEAVKLAATGTEVVQVHPGYGDVKRKGSKTVIHGEGSWKKAGPKDECARAGVVVLGKDKGQVLRVCTDRDCPKHFPKPKASRSSSHTTTRRSKSEVEAEKKRAAAQAAKRELEDRTKAAIYRACLETVTTVTPALLRLFAEEALQGLEIPSDAIAAVITDMTGLKTSGRYGGISGKVEDLTDRQVYRVIAAAVIGYSAYDLKNLTKVASQFKVNAKTVIAQVEREAAAAAKQAKATAKAEAKAKGKAKAPAKKKAGRK